MNQEEFNRLIKMYLDDNNIEKALDLYMKNEMLSPFLIEEFIVKIKSSYYACYLISIKGDNMNLDGFIDMIIKTNDKTFIGEVALNNLIRLELTKNNFDKLKRACEENK